MLKTGLSIVALMLVAGAASAQDVPGIEICTVEKTMERRTSCLQSNIDFLKKSMTKDALEQQKKLDAARGDAGAIKVQLEALRGTVATLQKTVEQLQSQIQAQAADKKPKEAPAK